MKVRLSATEFGKEVDELLEQAVISVCSKSEVRDGEISVTLLGDHEIQENLVQGGQLFHLER